MSKVLSAFAESYFFRQPRESLVVKPRTPDVDSCAKVVTLVLLTSGHWDSPLWSFSEVVFNACFLLKHIFPPLHLTNLRRGAFFQLSSPLGFHRFVWFRMLFLQVHDFLPSSEDWVSMVAILGKDKTGVRGGLWVAEQFIFILCFVGVLLSKVNSLEHNFIDALGPYFCLFSSHTNKLVSQ